MFYHKKEFTRKLFISVLIFFLGTALFAVPKKASAVGEWGTSDIFGDLMMQMMDNIKRQIEGALLGTLKMSAIQMLNSKVGQLVGGVAGGKPLFITNFNEFLYQTPQQNANLYMNDFFSMTTRGKGSSANYISAGGGSGLSGDYTSYLIASAKSVTTEGGGTAVYNLDQYGGMAAFSRGDRRAFNAFFNSGNNPFGYQLAAAAAYQNKLATEQKIAEMKALSSGFLPVEKNGIVVAPATSIEATFNNAADLPNKMIAAASNPGEFLSGVVSAMANKLVSNLIQKGVDEVQSKISNTLSNIDNKISGAVGTQTKQLGPAVQYMNNVNQNVSAVLKTNTPPPPVAIPPDP